MADDKRKKQGSELSQARDLLKSWRSLPALIAFLLVSGFFMVWALLRLTDSRDIAAYIIMLLVSGTALAIGLYFMNRLVRHSGALIQRINDMEQEQARIQSLADVDTRRLETPDEVVNATVFSDKHTDKQKHL